MTDPKQRNEFTSFDDFDNDGWNNSTIEREEKLSDDVQIEKEEDEGIPLENYEVGEDDC